MHNIRRGNDVGNVRVYPFFMIHSFSFNFFCLQALQAFHVEWESSLKLLCDEEFLV